MPGPAGKHTERWLGDHGGSEERTVSWPCFREKDVLLGCMQLKARKMRREREHLLVSLARGAAGQVGRCADGRSPGMGREEITVESANVLLRSRGDRGLRWSGGSWFISLFVLKMLD